MKGLVHAVRTAVSQAAHANNLTWEFHQGSSRDTSPLVIEISSDDLQVIREFLGDLQTTAVQMTHQGSANFLSFRLIKPSVIEISIEEPDITTERALANRFDAART